MKIILLNKMSKGHKLNVLKKGLIICNNPKSIEKSHRLSVEGTRATLSSGLAYKNMSSLAFSIYTHTACFPLPCSRGGSH